MGGIKTTQQSSWIREETQEMDIMTPGEKQYDIEIIIERKRERNIMTLRERCSEANTEIIVVKEGCRGSRMGGWMREQDGGRKRKGEGRDDEKAGERDGGIELQGG